VSLIDELDEEGKLYVLLQDPEDAASARGCYVVYPKEDELQIDCDSEDAFKEFKKRWEEFESVVTYDVEWRATPSSSGLPHRHITVTAKGRIFSVWERIALQFALGSDPVREKLCVLRYTYGIPEPVRFFEPEKNSD
jgi:hypothetical protein